MSKYLILTDYDVFYGKDGYSCKERETPDESKCFDTLDEAYDAADHITDHSYDVVAVSSLSEKGTFNCQHCERDYEHQHVIDRKGNVHATILKGAGK